MTASPVSPEPTVAPALPVELSAAVGSGDLLAELARVSALRELLQVRLESVHAELVGAR